MVEWSENKANKVSKHTGRLLLTTIKKIKESSKRPDSSAIFREITQAANLKLKYKKERIQTLIGDGKTVNSMTANGLHLFSLKRDDKPMSEIVISDREWNQKFYNKKTYYKSF